MGKRYEITNLFHVPGFAPDQWFAVSENGEGVYIKIRNGYVTVNKGKPPKNNNRDIRKEIDYNISQLPLERDGLKELLEEYGIHVTDFIIDRTGLEVKQNYDEYLYNMTVQNQE